jgi:hypothetical protein
MKRFIGCRDPSCKLSFNHLDSMGFHSMFEHSQDTVKEVWSRGVTATSVPADWMTAIAPNSYPIWSEGYKMKPLSVMLTKEQIGKLWELDVEVCGECADIGLIFVVQYDMKEL